MCLQSNMLGFECLVPEQCSKKVANSNCIGGICRCESGYLQFRRHTCLTAAKLGDVCYSDMHCRLWDSDSHCDFMIRNLFGRCVCNAPLKQSRSGTCQPNIVSLPSTTTIPSADFLYPAVTQDEIESKPTSQKTLTFAMNSTMKVPSQQKTPTKIKPDSKPINKTKPTLLKPEHRPPKPDSKPPNKFDSKPNKPDRPLSKPEKPSKKPDQKFQLGQFLNKTHLQLEQLSDKLTSFYQAATNNKPNKLTTLTSKLTKTTTTETPKTTTAATKSPTTSVKPNKSTPLNSVSPPKSSREPVKTEIIVKPPEIKLQDDKILIVNNLSKKPPKNKLTNNNKTSAKNPFLPNFPFLGDKENNTSFEETVFRYPTNLNKQVENLSEGNAEQEISGNISSVLRPLHHRVAEDLTTTISLGYACKTDQQCMRNDNNSRCLNGVCDCTAKRIRLDNACSAKNRGCHKGTFQCKSSGICISWFFVCDGRKDCSDGSDEDCKEKKACPEHTFRCGSSVPAVCISQASRCDGNADCPNGEDEFNCTATKYKGCPLHTFQCEDGRCLPEYEFCNAVISCEDGSDEPDNSCTATWNTSVRNLRHCPFRCSNGRCRSSAVVCSGRDGCGDNSDESRCSVCKCPPPT